jgi:hypothetical protein
MTSTNIYPLPYVYKITNKETGEFYIGSRYANVTSNTLPENDLCISYFTSSKLEIELKTYPEKFTSEILFKHGTEKVAYWYEQLLIRDNIKSKLCLNEHFIDPDSEKGFHNGGWNKGLSPSDETRAKLSFKSKGKPKSEEHKKNIGKSNIGKHSAKHTCPHCGTISIKTVIVKYHMDKCGKGNYFKTPFGTFRTSYEAQDKTGISRSGILNMCKDNERIINIYSLRKCKQLSKDWLNKTYKEVGFCMELRT